jgi:hypothetical protein
LLGVLLHGCLQSDIVAIDDHRFQRHRRQIYHQCRRRDQCRSRKRCGTFAAGVNDAAGQFATAVNGTGGAPSVANIFADFPKIEKEQREFSRPRKN